MTAPWKRRWNPDESLAYEQWAQEQADREDDLREPVDKSGDGVRTYRRDDRTVRSMDR